MTLREAAQRELDRHTLGERHRFARCNRCGVQWPCPGREFALLVLNTLDQAEVKYPWQGAITPSNAHRLVPDPVVHCNSELGESLNYPPDPVVAATPEIDFTKKGWGFTDD